MWGRPCGTKAGVRGSSTHGRDGAGRRDVKRGPATLAAWHQTGVIGGLGSRRPGGLVRADVSEWRRLCIDHWNDYADGPLHRLSEASPAGVPETLGDAGEHSYPVSRQRKNNAR